MKTLQFALIAAVTAVLMGCKVESDPEAQQKLQQGAEQAWQTTKEKSAEIGKNISTMSQQAKETSRIKYALSTSDKIDSSHLSVETVDKTIYLKGSVPTQEMKDAALNMAKAIANNGYSVSDDIKVEANPSKPSKPETRVSDDQPVTK